MSNITYCSKTNCLKLSCDRNQYNAPKNRDISIADLDNGCWGLYEDPGTFTYCIRSECIEKDCRFHLTRAPRGYAVTAKDFNEEHNCLKVVTSMRERLMKAICNGTQKTNYKCDSVCKAMCGSDGVCAYCATIADAIEEEFGK